MIRRTLAIVIGVLSGINWATALGADFHHSTARTVVIPLCTPAWRCGPLGCRWYRDCYRGCPDGLSCYPLYGAYGPYGGTAYWGAYSENAWDSYAPGHPIK